jgi:transposase-like protein
MRSEINLSAIAREFNVSRETLRSWKNQGVDLTNPAAVADKLRSMKSAPTASLSEARLQKLNLESERLRLQVDEQRGKLVSADIIYQDARSIGSQVRQRLDKAASNDLPPLLAGRNAAEIKVLLTKYFRDLCTELAHTKHPITENL